MKKSPLLVLAFHVSAVASVLPAQTPALSTPTLEMLAVLDELASFGGKPIELLRPSAARNELTSTDTVATRMKK